MTVTQMIYFQAICESSSVTQAASSLNVSQPALSNAIKDLENEFGLNLFHRQNKRFVLTKEGEYFLSKVIPFLDEFSDLSNMMMSLGNARNSIKLGISSYASGFMLPSLINDFHKIHPEINFEIQEMPVRHISKYVSGEILDVGIVNTASISPSEFEIYNFYRTETVFCVNKNNPLAKYKEIDFQTIGNQPIVTSTPNPRNSDGVINTFKSAGIEPNIILQADQVFTIIEYIRRDLAAGFLYRETAKGQPDIVQIPVKGLKPITIGLIVYRHGRIYADTAKFIQFIKDGIESNTLFPEQKNF